MFICLQKTLFFLYCPLLQHLCPAPVWTLHLGACPFKTPPSQKDQLALIGQLSQAWARPANLVSASHHLNTDFSISLWVKHYVTFTAFL